MTRWRRRVARARAPRSARASAGARGAVHAGIVAGVAMLAGGTVTAAGAAAAGPAQVDPVRIVIGRVEMRTDGTLLVSGTLRATGSTPVDDLTATLETGSALGSRGQLDAQLDGSSAPAATTFLGSRGLSGTVRPGVGVPFSFDVRTAVGSGAGLGVRPIEVTVSGRVAGGTGTQAVGHEDTYVVEPPATGEQATPVTVVLPLADRPRLRADNVLTDDQLAAEIHDGGRLDRLLDAATATLPRGRSTPVVLAVEPATIEAVDVMTRPYSYVDPGTGAVRHQAADKDATAFLARLRAFRGTVVALPYGDVDVAALVRRGETAVVDRAVTAGRTALAARLGHPVATGVAVPAGGQLDQAAVDALAAAGDTTFVMDAQAFPVTADLTYTPTAVTDVATVAGDRRVLVSDAHLTRLVSTSPAAATNPVAVRQQVLADVAMNSADRPGDARPLVVSLPRYWNPPGSWATTVVTGLAGAAWVQPAGNPATVAAGPVAAAGLRGPLTYSGAARAAELPSTVLGTVDAIRTAMTGFAGALAAGRCSDESSTTGQRTTGQVSCAGTQAGADPGAQEPETAPVDQALYRAVSVAWRGQLVDGAAYTDGVDQALRAVQGAVSVVASRAVTLTSRSGKVPVTLQNDLSAPIDVRLRLSAGDRARLRSDATVSRTVPAKTKVQVEIEVQAESAGTFPVDLTLLAPNGTPLNAGPPQRVLVKSTAYGVIAVAITVGAAGVLFVAAGVRVVRRLRGARASRAHAPPADRSAA